ncbi:MAG TPA: AAA family ATPase [bacterium]|nr:AAA family ATPase [bacterium]
MQRGRGAVAPVTDADRVTEAVVEFAGRKGFSLSEGQQKSTQLILTTRDRVIGIEGYAGTGKTTMLELVRQEAERNGYAIRGYCPSAAAAKVLQKETGIVSTTLASHLLAQKKEGTPPTGGKELWIIDEASMVSTLQAADLLKAAEKQQARIVLLGDRKQLASVEAGKPFAQLIDNGMAYEKITEIRRQKNVRLREAVYEAMDPEKIVSSLRKLDIEKVPDQHKRLDRMVGDYLALPAADRAKTLLLTSTNDDRRALNGAVRQGLKKEGTLTGPALETGILITTGLTKAELGKIESYHEGQMLRFNRKYKTLGSRTATTPISPGWTAERDSSRWRRPTAVNSPSTSPATGTWNCSTPRNGNSGKGTPSASRRTTNNRTL